MTNAPDLGIDAGWVERVLEGFLRREVKGRGKQRVVLGLSGGVDSATVAYLAARALGPERLHCVLLPSRTSHPDSLVHAREVVQRLGAVEEIVDVTPLVDGFAHVTGEVDPLRLGNATARARMLLLFDRSQRDDALVLGTSNKSELLLGYGTLFGDLACAINPIGDLYKTQVFVLAEHLQVPREIRQRPPSADLWPGQTDEQEFGYSYAEVDRLLVLLVQHRAGRRRALEAGFAEEMVDEVLGRMARSQFKRVGPVVARVLGRSLGHDFRYVDGSLLDPRRSPR